LHKGSLNVQLKNNKNLQKITTNYLKKFNAGAINSDIKATNIKLESPSNKTKNDAKLFSLGNSYEIKEDPHIMETRQWIIEKEALTIKKKEFLKKYLNREYMIPMNQNNKQLANSLPKYTFDFNGKLLLINNKIQLKSIENCNLLFIN